MSYCDKNDDNELIRIDLNEEEELKSSKDITIERVLNETTPFTEKLRLLSDMRSEIMKENEEQEEIACSLAADRDKLAAELASMKERRMELEAAVMFHSEMDQLESIDDVESEDKLTSIVTDKATRGTPAMNF